VPGLSRSERPEHAGAWLLPRRPCADPERLCQRCHRLLHDGFLAIEGSAPDDLIFRIGRASPGVQAIRWQRGIRMDDPCAELVA
jgi:hypothetical protein